MSEDSLTPEIHAEVRAWLAAHAKGVQVAAEWPHATWNDPEPGWARLSPDDGGRGDLRGRG